MSVKEVVEYVRTPAEARRVIAALTARFATPTAVEELKTEARVQKRAWQTVVYYTAGNLLRLGRSRKYQM